MSFGRPEGAIQNSLGRTQCRVNLSWIFVSERAQGRLTQATNVSLASIQFMAPAVTIEATRACFMAGRG